MLKEFCCGNDVSKLQDTCTRAGNANYRTLLSMDHAENFCEFEEKWQLYKDKICHGKLGFTAQSITNVNKARLEIFKSRYEARSPDRSLDFQMSIDISLLTCRQSLRMHCLCVCYQVYIWQHAHIQYPTSLLPDERGWRVDGQNKLAVLWTDEGY